ncbi:MAG: argininosuccinate synthase [Bacteroidales bacterium]|jgi:argininosuccinate synthase|nr:argininosuccinate synthase [Bacteroidales bacterium]
MENQKEKIVLAFSGGLDTSFCVPYLTNERNFEVHTVTVNTGGFNAEEVKTLEKKAITLGAKSHTTIDATKSYYENGIKYMIFGNCLRNNSYPLSVSSERIFQAMETLKVVKKTGAKYVAHGSTGAGNDQIRFDIVFDILAPEVEIVAPIRELQSSRRFEIDYLKKHNFDYSWDKSKYSLNQGIWGTSICGVETLSSDGVLPEEAFPHKVEKQNPEMITIGFSEGEPVSLNGKEMEPLDVIRSLAKIADPYGIGRDVNVGDTIIGLKGRVGFEAAAPMIIIKAHHLLEKHTLTKSQQYWKEMIGNYYGQLMHEAQYLDPVMRNMEVFLKSTQKNVTGTVKVILRPYCFDVAGCSSKYDLMNAKFGEYGEINKSYGARDIIGFTKVLANPSKVYYTLNEKEKELLK